MDGERSGVVNDQRQEMNLEQAASNPKLCSDFLSGGFDLCGLQQVLQNADHTWMEKFLQNGGLPNLLSTLDRKGDSSNNLQECVVCVKIVLNHKLGVKFIFEQSGEDQLIIKLVQVLDTDCVALKQDVLELLSALCLLSDKGYNLSLDALESYYKQSKHEQCRFSILMKEMRESSSEEYLASILAFINSILKRANDLKKRIRLRNEFLALQLLDVLSAWRHTTNEALAIQIQVFNEAHAEDNDYLDKPGGVDVNSHEDMFHAVLNKVCCTGHNKSFLIVLRNLLSFDRDDPTLDTIWEDMEQLCSQAVHSGASTESAATHSQVETKLRVETDSADLIPDSHPSPCGPPPPPPTAPGGPPPPPPPPGAVGVLAATSEKMTKVAKSREYKPQKNLKMINKVNWSKLSRGPATNIGAIWQKAAEGEMDTKVDIDPATVEELFAKPDVKKVEEKTKPIDEKGKTVKVFDLDLETERDTAITLRGLKMKNSTVVDSIDKLDPSKMTVVQLKALEKQVDIVKEKLESYKSAQGDFPDDSTQLKLSAVQDFYLQLTRVDRPDLRIRLMTAQVEFIEMLANLESPSSALEHAVDEILECETLTQLFLVILTAGNIINGGTFNGNAYGFKIESLQWLKETKSRYSEVSFLHFIAQVCEDQSPDLLQILNKLPSLKKASRVIYEDLDKEIKKVKDKVDSFEASFRAENLGEDVQAKFVIVSGDIQKSLKRCKEILGRISEKKEQLAVYFCEDSRKLKLEELLKHLLSFVTEFNKAREANSDKRRKVLLNRKIKEVAEERKRKTVATQTSASGRIQSDFGEPELETEDEGIIDDLLMEIKAGRFHCRWFL